MYYEDNSFKHLVKHRLVDLDKSDAWLIKEVAKDTGLYFDSGYLSKIFNGKCKPKKIINSICQILEIEYFD